MRLLFILYGLFDSNSGIQAFHFANLLRAMGWDVTLACEDDPRSLARVGRPDFDSIPHKRLGAKLEEWRRDPAPSIVCAWTPRENVRKWTLEFARELGVPYTVHLEDNEEYLLSTALRRSIAELRALPLAEQDRLTPPELSHPSRAPQFIADAAGVTVITEALDEFNTAGRPHRVIRPGADTERFAPDITPTPGREKLGLGEQEFVIVYHGNTQYANQHEMLGLYTAVNLLRRDGLLVQLVQLGNTVWGGVDPLATRALAAQTVQVGPVPWLEVPGYLALADAFVQPGSPDDFNRYRLPSKLPEFLAMGRPVILPRCNLGVELTHGQNGLLLKSGTASEIAGAVRKLIADPCLREHLGHGSRAFARRNLSWETNASAMSDFYRHLIETHLDAPSGTR